MRVATAFADSDVDVVAQNGIDTVGNVGVIADSGVVGGVVVSGGGVAIGGLSSSNAQAHTSAYGRKQTLNKGGKTNVGGGGRSRSSTFQGANRNSNNNINGVVGVGSGGASKGRRLSRSAALQTFKATPSKLEDALTNAATQAEKAQLYEQCYAIYKELVVIYERARNYQVGSQSHSL
jgi:hypothetical protein